MDSEKLNDWLQVIGLFGVIASLIFVGLQMKQEQEIAMSAAYQARTEHVTSIIGQYYVDPVFRSGMIKAEAERFDELTADEIEVIRSFVFSIFSFYENIHFQYLNGFIDDEHWAKSRSGLKNVLREGGARLIFENERAGWRESFRAFVRELIAEIDAEAAE